MKLKRLWQGEIHEVIVGQGYYKYKGEQYPTLYSVVVEIAGARDCPKQLDRRGRYPEGKRPEGTRKLTSWSAPRFFKLHWLIPGGKDLLKSHK
jgi:hypothetical protein